MSGTRQSDRNTQAVGGGWSTRAWIAVVLIPVFFFISFAVGEGLYALFGYKPENVGAPFWVDLVITVLTLAVLLLPCVAAVVFGRRASAEGDRSALVPAGIASLVGLFFIVLSTITLIAAHT